MKTFFNVEDLGNLDAAIAEALEVKKHRLTISIWERTRPC